MPLIAVRKTILTILLYQQNEWKNFGPMRISTGNDTNQDQQKQKIWENI